MEHPPDTRTSDDGFVLYREVQRWWSNRLLAVLMPSESVITGGVLLAVGMGAPRRDQLIMLALWVGFGVILPALFLSWSLVTEVSPTHLRARFVGLRTWRVPLDEVETAEPRRVDPLMELGGWGIRRNKRFGKVLNVAGDHVVIVTLTDGSKRTLGTRRPDELAAAILAGAMGEPGRAIFPAGVGGVGGPAPDYSESGMPNA